MGNYWPKCAFPLNWVWWAFDLEPPDCEELAGELTTPIHSNAQIQATSVHCCFLSRARRSAFMRICAFVWGNISSFGSRYPMLFWDFAEVSIVLYCWQFGFYASQVFCVTKRADSHICLNVNGSEFRQKTSWGLPIVQSTYETELSIVGALIRRGGTQI